MDDAVRGLDIGGGHSRGAASSVGDDDLVTSQTCGQLATRNGFDRGFAAMALDQTHQVAGGHATGDSVVGQDVREGALVLRPHQRCNGAVGQLCKSSVGRSEHGEGARARQRASKVSGDNCSNERGVNAGALRGLNDVRGLLLARARTVVRVERGGCNGSDAGSLPAVQFVDDESTL